MTTRSEADLLVAEAFLQAKVRELEQEYADMEARMLIERERANALEKRVAELELEVKRADTHAERMTISVESAEVRLETAARERDSYALEMRTERARADRTEVLYRELERERDAARERECKDPECHTDSASVFKAMCEARELARQRGEVLRRADMRLRMRQEVCDECKWRPRGNGHAPDCALAAALKDI